MARRNAGQAITLTTEPETWKRPLSSPLRDRATTFFIRQYTFDVSNGALQDSHEYLPFLIWNERSAFGLISTTVAAAGFAALSNAGNVSEWRSESIRLYQIAIQQLQNALQDPVQRVADETLGAVLLMGTFETIAFADTSSMKAFSQHIIAAARCIEMRGPQQFQTPVGLKLFMQMRRHMITTCHQLQEPFPLEIAKWSQWAEPHQTEAYIPINQLSQINEALAGARAELKYQEITDPDVISNRLLPFDVMMEEWAQSLPASWEYKSYRSVGPDGVPSSRYDLQYDTYTNPWIACLWNCYRNARLLVHESIIVATLKHGTEQQQQSLQSSYKVLRIMADGICHSAAYHLGYRQNDENPTIDVEDNNTAPGGFLLLWPLFFAAVQRTSPPEQRLWAAGIIRQIGKKMGLQVALSMAGLLEETKDFAFSNQETFLLGEWHPN
ncbi:uncharacterized protein FIESC28_02683 [Fusarium coffeatum]|uniref:Transcription factor domain-containing protein n=1 Tax=Fusarium coffeatum TaxID=231269 RepID=A0A366S568_9HYPO|nr:uncharacterized protein FIESC28_02683 [Fusarium coffeatum]RBR24487.1 hypothetical protein FIESC28_02683 [Fusarium coffeatum]